MEEEIDELTGRVEAVECVLHVLLSELGRNVPARQKVKEASKGLHDKMRKLQPTGSRLLGIKTALANMGIAI